MRKSVAAVALILLATTNSTGVGAETPDEWVALGARVHGGFGAFIPLGIKIGLDALDRLHLKQRDVSVTYYDSDESPCACFADGIAIATLASVGQRSLTIEREHASDGTAAVVIIRPRGGVGLRYTIPLSVLPEVAKMNRELDPRGRYDAVMKAEGLFDVAELK